MAYLVLCQPQSLQIEVGQGEGQVGQSVPGNIEHMKFCTRSDFRRQAPKLILTETEDSQTDKVACKEVTF